MLKYLHDLGKNFLHEWQRACAGVFKVGIYKYWNMHEDLTDILNQKSALDLRSYGDTSINPRCIIAASMTQSDYVGFHRVQIC